MDASLLTRDEFWFDLSPPLPGVSELSGHWLFETSGSSGKPKAVALSKRALLISASAVNQHLAVTRESCWGLVLPIHHVGGFGVAARAYQAACGFQEFGQRWAPRAFCNWIEQREISHTSLVPTQVHDLVVAKHTAPSHLKAIVVGGGHLNVAMGQAARDLGWPILASYGMTETASQVATQSLAALAAPYQPSPIPLLPIWQAKMAPPDSLFLSGPALFSGYVIDGKYLPRTSDWYQTSDRAELTDHGLTPLGRADVLVKVLGELVDPEAIEQELMALSDGRLLQGSFAIIATLDERAGHALTPVIEASGDRVLFERMLELYAQNALGFRRLKPSHFIPIFPRSELGKIRRSELAIWLSRLS
jgi:o-succinylbenzoate---CoA ligase